MARGAVFITSTADAMAAIRSSRTRRFESDANNLSVNSRRRVGDPNHHSDVYLYTDVRNLTLVQSVKRKAVSWVIDGVPSISTR